MFNVRWPEMSDKAELGVKVWRVFSEVGMEADQYRSRPPNRWFGELAVAEDAGGQVVGAVQARFNLEYYNENFGEFAGLRGPQCMVDKIAVQPSLYRSGVGRLLMRSTAEQAHSRRCTHLALMVDWSNELNDRVSFFKACGLRSLAPERGDDLYGAEVGAVLHALT